MNRITTFVSIAVFLSLLLSESFGFVVVPVQYPHYDVTAITQLQLQQNRIADTPMTTMRKVLSNTMLLSSSSSSSTTTVSAPTDRVIVLKDAAAVGDKIKSIVRQSAKDAIAQRGHFMLAIPGGSILSMLVGLGQNTEEDNWTGKTTVVYVNHKCVPMNDSQLATHAKAMKLFLQDWTGATVLLMEGTDDGDLEASSYDAKIRALTSSGRLPLVNGLPQFDLALIGVGDDGHIGSLYPNREEVLVSSDGPWVIPVSMKHPPSITLSLPVMMNAQNVVVAACGVSEKYPLGKSDAMRRAIVTIEETRSTFPAVALRPMATWVLDEAAASQLGTEYC